MSDLICDPVQDHQVKGGTLNDSMSRLKVSIRFAPLTVLCLMQLICMSVSRADPHDVLSLEAGVQRSFDDNLFRIPDSVDPYTLGAGGHERSDTITTGQFGFMLDQGIGLQKLHFEALETYYDYQNYRFLDGTTTNYLASWQLAVTRALTGKLSTSRLQSPANFAYYQVYNRRDIITQDSTDLILDLAPTGTWHLTTDMAKRKYIDSANDKQIASYDYNFIETGLLYGFSSGGSIGVLNDNTTGTFLEQALNPADQLDTGFKQNEEKLALIWPFTTDSLLNAQVGYVERQYDHFSIRNYSGTTANVSFSYGALDNQAVTGQLPSGYTVLPLNYGFLVAFTRTYNPYVNEVESYYVDDKKTVQALWMPTPKINVKLRVDANKNDFAGPLPNVITAARNDTDNTYTFELDWNPSRTIALALTLAREKRNSTAVVGSLGCIAGCDYTDNIVGLSFVYNY